MIKTMLGNFTKGEKVAIVMYGPCGQEYVYKGIELVKESLKIAADICIYTNHNIKTYEIRDEK